MRNFRFFALLLLLFPTSFAFSQVHKQDSLFVLLKKTGEDTNRVKLFNQLAFSYHLKNLAKTEKYAKSALELAQKLDYPTGIAAAHNNLGVAASVRGDYENAVHCFLRALTIQDKTHDLVGMAKSYNNLSAAFGEQGSFDKAREFSQKALKINLQSGMTLRAADNYFVLGIICFKQKKNDEAMPFFLKALQRYQQLNEKQRLGSVYGYIGNICEREKKFDKAGWYYRQALQLAEKMHDQASIANCYSDLGSLHLQLKHYETAGKMLYKGLSLAEKYGFSEKKLTIYQHLSDVSAALNDYPQALLFYKKYALLKDSLFTSLKSRQVSALQVEYETLQKEKENQILKTDLEAEKQKMIFISIVLALSVGLSGVWYVYYRSKRKANWELQKLNEEIRQQKEEIEAQAEVLQGANQLIVAANETLEQAVQERTQQLEEATHQILAYAFLNSHKVRGPLARIIGLNNLLKQNMPEEEIPFIIQSLQKSTEELDLVIRELNDVLQVEKETIFRDKILR